jgi:TolB-like protein/Flp pilus assembly protein TadD
MKKLHLQLLGHFSLKTSAGLNIEVTSKKAKALLAYLAISSQPVSRASLAELLWERHDRVQAMTNLRQALSVIQRLFPPQLDGWIVVTSQTMQLNAAYFDIDINSLHSKVSREFLQGPFLQELIFHEEQLSEWLNLNRQHYQLAIIRQLKQELQELVVNSADESIDPEQISSLSQRIFALDPIDESVYQLVMKYHLLRGERSQAIQTYQQCLTALKSHSISQAQIQTKLLYDSIVKPSNSIETLEQDDAAPESLERLQSNEESKIAVLAFHQDNSVKVGFSISTALCEEIVSSLRRFRELTVISAMSSLSINSRQQSPQVAAKMLGVRYLVGGSIRQCGSKVQVSVELVDASNGELLWAEGYARQFGELFSLQHELARDIASALQPEAMQHALLQAKSKGPNSLTAWELVLKGNYYLYKQIGTMWNSHDARSNYQRAIELDPDYAPAYAGMAYSLCLDVKESIAGDRQIVLDRMKEMSEHAVRLDPNDSWCLVVLGRVLQQREEYDEAMVHYRNAAALCPGSAKVHFGMGFGLSAIGLYAEAVESLDRALELSPRDPMSWSFNTVKAFAYMYAEMFDSAELAASTSCSNPSANHWARIVQVPSLIHLGQKERALEGKQQALKQKPELTVELVERAFPVKHSQSALSIRDGLIEAGLPRS